MGSMNRLIGRQYAPYPLLEPRLDGWLLSAEWKPGPFAPLFEWCGAGVELALGGETGLAFGAFRFIIISVVAALLPWPCVRRICESSS